MLQPVQNMFQIGRVHHVHGLRQLSHLVSQYILKRLPQIAAVNVIGHIPVHLFFFQHLPGQCQLQAVESFEAAPPAKPGYSGVAGPAGPGQLAHRHIHHFRLMLHHEIRYLFLCFKKFVIGGADDSQRASCLSHIIFRLSHVNLFHGLNIAHKT